MMEEKLIGYKQVCQLVGVSRAHIGRFVHDEEYRHLGFPKPIQVGSRRLFVWSEVQQWIASTIASKRDAPV